jgi:hypothetical protein
MMQAHLSSVDSAADTTSAHAVLFSDDLVAYELWQRLDRASKVALRGVSRRMRNQVDGAVKVVVGPSLGANANQLRSALLRWPGVRDLTLLDVGCAASLAPLSTASLAGLTILTVREVGHVQGHAERREAGTRACLLHGAWRAHAFIPLSSACSPRTT